MITVKNELKEKANVFASTLIEVLPHIGRLSPKVSLPKDLSEYSRLQKSNDEDVSFITDNLVSGKVFLFPELEKKALKIDGQIRHAINKHKLVFDYLLYDEYKKIETWLEEKRVEYLQLKNMVMNWDEEVFLFRRNLRSYLKNGGISEDSLDKTCSALLSGMPTKEQWENSFYVDVEVREFPVLPGLIPNLKSKWEERTKNLDTQIKKQFIADLLDAVDNILKKISNEKDFSSDIRKMESICRRLNYNLITDPEILDLGNLIINSKFLTTDVFVVAEELEENILPMINNLIEKHNVIV